MLRYGKVTVNLNISIKYRINNDQIFTYFLYLVDLFSGLGVLEQECSSYEFALNLDHM